MKKLGIVGVGLIGGSIGSFFTEKIPVLGIGRDIKKLNQAKRLGLCSEISTDFASIAECDFVILATPVDTIIPVAAKLIPLMKKNSILIDVGSVKGKIVEKITLLAKKNGVHFVGCHPMAGSEKSGFLFADKNLFKDTNTIITPIPATDEKAIKKVKKFWEDLGSKVFFLKPSQHDRIASLVSHLPHVLAFCFASLVKGKNLENFAGRSFQDIIRLSQSSPNIWIPIFKHNKKNISILLEKYIREIKKFKRNL